MPRVAARGEEGGSVACLIARVASMYARAYYFRSPCRKNDRYYIAPATVNYQVSLRSEKFIAPYSLGKYTRRAMSKHEKEYFFGDQRLRAAFQLTESL